MTEQVTTRQTAGGGGGSCGQLYFTALSRQVRCCSRRGLDIVVAGGRVAMYGYTSERDLRTELTNGH